MFVPRITPVQSIVLRAIPWREKDRLLVLLTRERGKVLALAQGAQIPQNRLAPVTQCGVIATFWLAKAREFDRVTDYRIEKLPTRIRREVLALTAFGIVSELLEWAAPAEVADKELFSEVLWFAGKLEEGSPPVKWLVAAEVRLLERMGWMPHLLSCSICGVDLCDEQIAFSPSIGGSICDRCRALKAPPDAQIYPSAVLQGIYALWQQPELMTTLHLRQAFWQQALTLLQSHWSYHLEVEIKAWKVWKQITASPVFATPPNSHTPSMLPR